MLRLLIFSVEDELLQAADFQHHTRFAGGARVVRLVRVNILWSACAGGIEHSPVHLRFAKA